MLYHFVTITGGSGYFWMHTPIYVNLRTMSRHPQIIQPEVSPVNVSFRCYLATCSIFKDTSNMSTFTRDPDLWRHFEANTWLAQRCGHTVMAQFSSDNTTTHNSKRLDKFNRQFHLYHQQLFFNSKYFQIL